MERRKFITQGMAGVSTLAIAGCSQSSSSDDEDESKTESDNGGSTGNSDGSGTEYRMYRYNSQNNGYISDQGPTSLSANWSGQGGYGEYPPAVVDETVFLISTNQQKLYALDTDVGEKQWEFPTEGKGTPAVDDDTVYVPGRDEKMHALDKSDGSRQWTFEPDDPFGNTAYPAVVDGTLYYSVREKLYAVDTENGEEQWTFSTGGQESRAPAVSDGTVYVTGDPNLYAINSSNGEQEWQSEIGYNLSSPVVADDSIYLGGSTEAFSGHKVYAVTTDGGEEVWNFELSSETKTPVVDDDSVYAVSMGGYGADKIFSLAKNDGSEQWRASAEGTSLVVADDMVYSAGDSLGGIIALDASNGDQQASWSEKHTKLGGLAVVNGTVYTGVSPPSFENKGVISLS